MELDEAFRAAHACMAAGDYAEAERRYLALVDRKPEWAWHNLAAVHIATHRFEAAVDALRRALQAAPGQAASAYLLGVNLMRLGRYAEGWPLMEARHKAGVTANWPRMACPMWRGEPLAGKRLVVCAEQGLGDQIQFFRFLIELAARGAHVAYVCPPALVRLLEGRGVQIVPQTPGGRIPDADYWTFIDTPPLYMDVRLETLSGAPYLTGQSGAGGGVGVMAAGNPAHGNDAHRSLPPGLAGRLGRLGRDLSPAATGATDFADTAAIVAGLDLVISVDTSVVHLAGAMGKPVWVLLPYVETDWRWLVDRADSPWYASARLFRQPAAGDWATVLAQVEAALSVEGLAPPPVT
jgi:hypothetical protein